MCWLHLFMHFILELDGLAFVRSDRGGDQPCRSPPFPLLSPKKSGNMPPT